MAGRLFFVACIMLCAVADAAVRFTLCDAKGVPVSSASSGFDVKTECTVSADGVETLCCRVKSLKDGESRMLLTASVLPECGIGRVFDGRKAIPFEGSVKSKLFDNCAFPMGAVWNGRKGLALSVGATCGDSHADLSVKSGEMKISVHAAFLKRGAVYETVFHSFSFDAKYGEGDAFAKYYALYPGVFSRHEGVDPRIYGISASYRSWRMADPELCRFSGATWEWCIGAARSWGDACNEWQPTLPRCGDWTWEEEIGYRRRNGKYIGRRNAKISREEFDRINEERLGFGYYCGVDNAFYMMALCNISKVVAAKYPDSVAVGKEVLNNSYPYSTLVFPFPEVGWGMELRRQLSMMAKKYDVGAVAFDVSGPGQVYRGDGLLKMSNVSWDGFGPGVVRGVGSRKLMEFLRTLDRKDGARKVGSIVNSGRGHVTDKFGADSVMSELSPWNMHPDDILVLRRASGEKGVTYWEGYSLEEFSPDVGKWKEEHRTRLLDELSRAAVHMSFKYGVSLPSSFLTEYTSLASHAFHAMNDAGIKPVPGAEIADSGWALTRYGLGTGSYIAVNNLRRSARVARITIHEGEIMSGFAVAGKGGEGGVLFVPFFGGKALNRFGNSEDCVEFTVGPLMAGVLEAVGTAKGSGSLSAEWCGDFDSVELTLRSAGFDGRIDLRSSFGTYRLQGTADRRLSPEGRTVAVYRNMLMPGIMARLDRVSAFDRIVHAADRDSVDMAERVAFFLRKATGKKTETVCRRDLPPRTLILGGEKVSDPARAAFSGKVTRLLNALNARRYKEYCPPNRMNPEDRARITFIRY